MCTLSVLSDPLLSASIYLALSLIFLHLLSTLFANVIYASYGGQLGSSAEMHMKSTDLQSNPY